MSIFREKASPEHIDRSWLIDRHNLVLVRSCRKSILSEFGIDLSLSQTDLLQQLHFFAAKSRDNNLPPIIDKLVVASGVQLPPLVNRQPLPAEIPAAQNYYRGSMLDSQTSNSNPTDSTSSTADTSATSSKKPPRIYRGQVIY